MSAPATVTAETLERIAAALEALVEIEAARRADEIAAREARRKPRPPREQRSPSTKAKRSAAEVLRRLSVR